MSRDTPVPLLWRVVAVVLLLALLWELREPAMLVFGAVLFAASLRALADPLAARSGLSPRKAVVLVLLATLLLLAAGLWLIGAPLSEQFGDLRRQLPQAWQAVRGWLERSPVGPWLLSLGDDLRAGALPWSNIASLASRTLQAIAGLVLILLMGLYLALDVALYRNGLVRLFPPARREAVGAALDAAGQALSRWLLGQLVAMAAVGITVAVALLLLGMPMALALGLIAGLLEFVPFFGPIASGALAVLVGFGQGPQQALYVGLVFLAIQQLEGNLLVPLVQRWAVDLPPALAVASVLVFGSLFGAGGVVFGTPLMVVAMVLVQRLYVEGTLERPLP